MLSAKQARETTDLKQIAKFKSEIEKSIKRAIEKGRDNVRISGKVPAEIIAELKGNEYIVEEMSGLTIIRW